MSWMPWKWKFWQKTPRTEPRTNITIMLQQKPNGDMECAVLWPTPHDEPTFEMARRVAQLCVLLGAGELTRSLLRGIALGGQATGEHETAAIAQQILVQAMTALTLKGQEEDCSSSDKPMVPPLEAVGETNRRNEDD